MFLSDKPCTIKRKKHNRGFHIVKDRWSCSIWTSQDISYTDKKTTNKKKLKLKQQSLYLYYKQLDFKGHKKDE